MNYVRVISVMLIALLLLAACSTRQEAERPIAPHFTDFEEAKAEAARTGRDILVDFSADWCKWCDKLDTAVFMDQKGIDFFTNKVHLVKIDCDKDSLLAKEQHVSALPTSILFDEDGVEIDRIIGFLEVDDYLKKVEDLQKGIGTLGDLLNRVKTETDRELYLEIAEKYKYRGGSEEAVEWYRRVIDEGDPADSLSGESRMSLADMQRQAKEFDVAIESFRSVIDDFEGRMFAQDAHIWIAIVHRQKGDTSKAIEAFEYYIETFPESEDIEYARGQINKLKGIEAQ